MNVLSNIVLKDASIRELYLSLKQLLFNEQIGFKKESKKLNDIYNELESRDRLDIYDEAINKVALEIEKNGALLPSFGITGFRKISADFRYELMELLQTNTKENINTVNNPDLGGTLSEILNIDEFTMICNVDGWSMVDANISDGDKLLVNPMSIPKDGDIVIASINGEKIVKRYREIENKDWFFSENKNFKPVEITDDFEVEFLGVVSAIIHNTNK